MPPLVVGEMMRNWIRLVESLSPDDDDFDHEGWTQDVDPGFEQEMKPARIRATPENIERARDFVLQKMIARHREKYGHIAALRDKVPSDLSDTCKFSSLFARELFGGRLRGNQAHQFVELKNGQILDLNADAADVARLGSHAYEHEPLYFWGNPEHKDALESCRPRVEKWVAEFLSDDKLNEDEGGHTTLEMLASQREEFVSNPGTDPDYESILDYLGMDGDEDVADIHGAYFDDLIAHYKKISAKGSVRVFRCISVKDVQRFIASLDRRRIGQSWASDRESASCDYHPEANHEHEILLIADAPETSICWEGSMVQNFGWPDEHEIVVDGPVHNLQVIYDGKIVHRASIARA